MRKIDFKKELKHLYNPSPKNVGFVDVPKMNFLMIDGAGDPNASQDFKHAVEALFGLSYTIKFIVKKSEMAIDYSVMPLEGLWWADDMSKFSIEAKSDWKWTLMIMQPEFISLNLVNKGINELQRKKDPVALSRTRFEAFEEGKSAQIMHIGPFSDEGPTVEKLHDVIKETGSATRGTHHEIYLSDIRKGDPARWRTVIRQPFQ